MDKAYFEIKTVLYVDGNVEYANKRTVYREHLSSYQLVYKLGGSNTVTFGKKTFKTYANSVHVLPEGDVDGRYIVDTEERGDCIDIFFDCNERFCSEPVVITDPSAEALRKLFLQLYGIWAEKKDGYYYRAMSIFYDIIYRIKKSSYIPGEKFDIIRPGIEHMRENIYDRSMKTTDLSEICGISYTYFSKLFKSYMGQTPVRYINSARLERACELLCTDKYTVEDITDMCGFDSTSYFCRTFKQYYNCTPSQYKLLRKKKTAV